MSCLLKPRFLLKKGANFAILIKNWFLFFAQCARADGGHGGKWWELSDGVKRSSSYVTGVSGGKFDDHVVFENQAKVTRAKQA